MNNYYRVVRVKKNDMLLKTARFITKGPILGSFEEAKQFADLLNNLEGNNSIFSFKAIDYAYKVRL